MTDYLDVDATTVERGSGRSSKGGGKATKKGSNAVWMFFKWFIIGVGVAIAIALLFRSFGIYQIAFDKFGITSFGNVCRPFRVIPWIGGWVFDTCGWLVDLLVGSLAFLVLLMLTILQSIPTLLYTYDKAISGMVEQIRHNRKMASKLSKESGDNEEIETLIDWHNSIGEKHLKTFMIISVIAFAAEAFIIWEARNGRADIISILIDALAFDALLFFLVSWNNLFRPIPKRVVKSYS